MYTCTCTVCTYTCVQWFYKYFSFLVLEFFEQCDDDDDNSSTTESTQPELEVGVVLYNGCGLIIFVASV